jgi:hypothetical protein
MSKLAALSLLVDVKASSPLATNSIAVPSG